ncbi:MAG TPA: copper homeostasis protein CutC [Bacteroidales bacterium]|nr:copper homeostasis protein CutC [Bacteroidales bacterium]
MLLEACVNSAISAVEAMKGGADRVELCENMAEGGCTPSAGTVRYAVRHLHIPVFVMIRPRGADFLYNEAEFEIMKEDVVVAKESGASGVVFGILTDDGKIDAVRMEELIRLARPMGITCHRAFDMTSDPIEALDTLIRLGVDRVLTSGQTDSALTGAPLIRELIRHASGRILIMPGHGIKEHNLEQVIRATGASEFHLYLPKKVRSSMHYVREEVKMGNPDLSEYDHTIIDHQKISRAKEIIRSFNSSSL